jgi:hypothetical protein
MLQNKDGKEYEEFASIVQDSFNMQPDNVHAKKKSFVIPGVGLFDGLVDANDQYVGYGRIEYYNGDSFEGKFWNGLYDGRGTKEYANGDRYDGNWNEGRYNELGRKEYANGDWYQGDWVKGKMHGNGMFSLWPRDWTETSRPNWSTGVAWTFKGSFEEDMAKNGEFDDGIQNGNEKMTIHRPLIPMIFFWIKAKLFKSDDTLNDTEKKQMFLPDNLYKISTEVVAPAEATRKMELKPLPKKHISLLLQQLLLIYKPISSQI